MKKFNKLVCTLLTLVMSAGVLSVPVHATSASPVPSAGATATADSSAAPSTTAPASVSPESTAGTEATPTASVSASAEPTAVPSVTPEATPTASSSAAASDEVVFSGEEEKTIAVGEEYVFTDSANISVQGPSADGETYRVFVRGVESPEEGSYVYTAGDVSFTPTEADIGFDYVVSYGAEVSTDGETWTEVEDSYFEAYLTVVEASEESPSVPPILRTPVYEGMIAELKVDLDEETPTGSLVTTNISVGINGTETVDEPFFLEVDMPKEGIYGTGDDVDARYRLQISDLPNHESTFTENDTYYIKTYTFQPDVNVQSYSIPLKFKFIRTGEVPDGTEYHITLKILDQQGNVVKTADYKTTLRVIYPTSDAFYPHSYPYDFQVEPNSPQLNADQTALTTDVSLLSYNYGSVQIYYPTNKKVRDANGDEVGIRKADHIIDTITFPSGIVIDTDRLPSGAVYDATTHTVTIQQDDVIGFVGTNGRIYFKLPGAIIDQFYEIQLKREYKYEDNPTDDFALENTTRVRWTIADGWYKLDIDAGHSKFENYDSETKVKDNNIGLESEPYIEGYLRYYIHTYGSPTVSTEDVNQSVTVNDTDKSYTFVAENDDADLAYQSIILNPSGLDTSYHGTVTIVGVKEDGSETTLASNFTYPDQSSATINITDEFKTVKITADSGSYFTINNKYKFDNTAPEEMEGLAARITYKIKSGFDSSEPRLFTGTLTILENGTPLNGNDNPRNYRIGHTNAWSTHYTEVFHYYFYYPTDIVYTKLKNTLSTDFSGSLVTPGQTFTVTSSLYANTLHDRSDLENGTYQITLPAGIEVVEGSESVTFNSDLTYEKTASQIIASRQFSVTSYSQYDRNVYSYDIGTISNLDQLSLDEPLITISCQFKFVEPTMALYLDDYAYTFFDFDDKSYDTYEITYTHNEESADSYSTLEKKHFYNNWYHYVESLQKYVNSDQFVTGLEEIVKTDENSTVREKINLNYQKNGISKTDVTRSNDSGYDYYNDEITLTYHLVVTAFATETYNDSKATLELPEGLEILSTSVTSNNDYFNSDKTLSEIAASYDGQDFDLGNVTITRGPSLDLNLSVTVKITDQLVAGEHYIAGEATFVNSLGYRLKYTSVYSSVDAKINYVPSTGFYSLLTGHDTTDKEYVGYGTDDIQYEITLGNYTGSDAEDVTIIDMLPGPGDCNGNGTARNSDIRPILKSVTINNSAFAVYYSVDEPSPGMTAAEYNALANWSSYASDLASVRAIKFAAGSSSSGKTGDLPDQAIGKIATIKMTVPEASDPEAYGELINNSISVRYVTGNLTSNFIDSNVKTYETRKSHKVRLRFFADKNGNDIYDSDDTFEVGNANISLNLYLRYGDYSEHISGRYYTQLNPTDYVYTPFPDYLYVPEGVEFQLTNISIYPTDLGENAEVCSYSSDENGSKVHTDTKTTDTIAVDASSPDIIYINVGIKFPAIEPEDNEVLFIFDYNGGYNRYTGQTRQYDIRTISSSGTVNLIAPSVNVYSDWYYPYHIQKPVWTTNPDGTGTSYAAGSSTVIENPVGGSTIIVYAQWDEVTQYNVVYNKNSVNAEGTMDPLDSDTVTVGQPYTIRLNLFTYNSASGSFENWNTKADGTGTDYYEGQVCDLLWDGDPANITYENGTATFNLYALWRQPFYTYISDEIGQVQNLTRYPDENYLENHNYLAPVDFYCGVNPLTNIKVTLNNVNEDGSLGTLVGEATSGQHGELYFPEVTAGVYYLTENADDIPAQHYKPAGSWKIKIVYDEFTGALCISSATPTVSGMEEMPEYWFGDGKALSHYILNSIYYYKNLTLTTRIADENAEYASVEQDFTYRLIFLDKQFQPIANQTFEYEGIQLSDVTDPNPAPSDGTITTDENGMAYITLKHGQGIKIKNVIGGTKVTVKMITEGGDVYSRVNDEGSTTIGFAYTVERIAATTLPDTEAGLSQVMDFEIHNYVPVPAGITSGSNTRQFMILAYAAVAALAGLLLLLTRLRKKLREQA